jgi:hypothetical protein
MSRSTPDREHRTGPRRRWFPGVVSTLQRWCSGSFEQVPRRLHGVEDADLECAVDRVGLAGTGHRHADRDAGPAQSGELAEQLIVSEHAALDRGRMDLIEVESVSEQLAGLGELPPEGVRAEVLALLHRLGHEPSPGIGISPLRPDHRSVCCSPATRQPRGQECLRETVGAGRIEIAHPPTPRRHPAPRGHDAPGRLGCGPDQDRDRDRG